MGVDVSYETGVAIVCIDNPPVNAMSEAVLSSLHDVVAGISSRRDIRVVVFSGASKAAFLSGADLTELPLLLADPELLGRRMSDVGSLYQLIADLPQVTIAAVGASAMGGGLELLLVCDFVVASERAKFGLPEVSIGLMPGAGGTQRLFQRIPSHHAREMLLLGAPIGAEQALRLGLISRMCPREEVEEQSLEMARQLAGLPAIAVQSIKRAIAAAVSSQPLDVGLDVEREEFLRVANSADAQTGPAAFLERRKPVFEHK
ncbi:enoyl-CoA hydratase-related protein [Rhodococcus ruber]|uniref:Enoyl-CoA hydratase-related protein n=1 Tax=Rhodococcus ruber TaxID=1830 RepID=A0ABT4MER1_9NOCA|nr:enoyl-CoA hydratase-related protein [Rhodococcus ruber]MCZ4519473.1 enoyl-CoA hydratase-related protein [Rhodococcus ruber]